MLRPFALLPLAVAGCATVPAFLPAEHDTGILPGDGLPAAVYALTDGEVRIAAVGIRREKVTGGGELVLRMRIRNDSDTPLRVDAREQRLVLPGDREVPPELGYFGGVPLYDVPPHGAESTDLIYAIGDQQPKSFALRWTVVTPHDYVARRTPFERQSLVSSAFGPPMINGWYFAPPFYDFATGNQFGFPPVATREGRPEPRVQGRHARILPATPPIEAPPAALPPFPTHTNE